MSAHTAAPENSPLLRAILNLSKFHREHEKFYASSPRELAVALQRHARSLQARTDRLHTQGPARRHGRPGRSRPPGSTRRPS
jgi:hypothetical protein